ncbi:MAG: hypothetical protein ACI8TP_003602, partial [Acidimicrobiales bacterium]
DFCPISGDDLWITAIDGQRVGITMWKNALACGSNRLEQAANRRRSV